MLPQSWPVSVPFLMPSVQAGVAHLPLLHHPCVQSESLLHFCVSLHFATQVPPQSMSDSEPFCTVSEQLGTVQTPAVPLLIGHHRSLQSKSTRQVLPGSQAVLLLRQ